MRFEQLDARRLLTSIVTVDPVTGGETEPTTVLKLPDFNDDGISDVLLLVNSSQPAHDYLAVVYGSTEIANEVSVSPAGVVDSTSREVRGIFIGTRDIYLPRERPLEITARAEISGFSEVYIPCSGNRIEVHTEGQDAVFEGQHVVFIAPDNTNSDEPTILITGGFDRRCQNDRVIFDFDGDGVEDQVTTTRENTTVDINTRFTRTDYRHSPIATRKGCPVFTRDGNGLADINEDGLADIIVERERALINEGNGFRAIDDLSAFDLPMTLSTLNAFNFEDDVPTVHQVDINNDGVEDAFSHTYRSGVILVYLGNDSDPVDEIASKEAFGRIQASISVQDVNADGHADVVLFTPGLIHRPTRISVHFGAGDGTFDEVLSVTAGRLSPQYTVLAIDDLDGDAFLEIVLGTNAGDVNVYDFTARIPGDANEDGQVDLADFRALLDNFGKAVDAVWENGDFNTDGAVDFNDFLLLSNRFVDTR